MKKGYGGFWGLDSKFLKVFDLKKQIVYLSPKPVIAGILLKNVAYLVTGDVDRNTN